MTEALGATIERLATVFRQAMDRCDKSSWGEVFAHYPEGICGQAAEMVGVFLADRLWLPVEYVWGENRIGDNVRSHGWIEIGGFIVDIAADQFGLPAIMVTADRRLHALWDEQGRGPNAQDGSTWLLYGARPYGDILREIATHGEGVPG